MEPYEAIKSTKYMYSLDENNFAVDSRLFEVWNILPTKI